MQDLKECQGISRITKIRLRDSAWFRVELNLGWKDSFSQEQGSLLSSNLDCILPTMAPINTKGLLKRKSHYFFSFLRGVFFPPLLEGLQYFASI